jgi:hypothetical protein
MRKINIKLINGLIFLLIILSVQMAGPRLLLAENNLSLTASPTSVTADGFSPSLITATVDTNGVVEQGIKLTFTTSRGLFSSGGTSIVSFSDAAGESVVALTSMSTGIATVTCLSEGGFVRVVYVNFTAVPQPTPTPNPPILSSFVLSANPPAVSADNQTPSTISAQLYDQYGKSLSLPGVSVVFTTTPDGLARFPNNLTTITVSTNGSGLAEALLYSPVVGTASVNATCGGLKANPVFVNFIGPGPTADIAITADPSSIPADNLSSSTITATLFDQNGDTVQSGVAVNFATTLGKFSNGLATIVAFTNASGVASVVIYSGSFSLGTAQVSAASNGVTRYVSVTFTGVGPSAFISLSSASNRLPADGHSYTAITAVVLDMSVQPVAVGTVVTFITTLGVFENGKTTYSVVTTDDTGTVTVHLRASSTLATGSAVITVTSGSASQSLTVQIVRLELETELNDNMTQADIICFDNMYLGQLKNPYEEDWYTFTVTTPSRIGINFITTAAPADANCDSGTTTVGTWKVDIRDSNNEPLMSRHNIDCVFDNGVWDAGVVPPGTYYVVVYCPRLGDGDIYLSDDYYLSVYNDFYFPCGSSDRMMNSASLSLESSAYQMHVPIIDPSPYLWVDFQYDPVQSLGLMFRVTDFGAIANLNDYRSCNMSTLSQFEGNYVLHVPVLVYNDVSYRADLTYIPTTDGQIWFMLTGAWLN